MQAGLVLIAIISCVQVQQEKHGLCAVILNLQPTEKQMSLPHNFSNSSYE